MDWHAPQLRRFDFSFPAGLPDVPPAEPPPTSPPPPSLQRSLNVVCYGAATEALLSLTRSSHPSFGRHCYTGLQTYSGAEVLARMMLRRPQIIRRGRAVMEIGCGIGLTGVVAAHCMAGQRLTSSDGATTASPLLLLTDGEEDAVRLARCNVWLNSLSEQQLVDDKAALNFLASPLAGSAQLSSPLARHHSASPAPAPVHVPVPVPVTAPLSVHALSARWDASGVALVDSYCEAAVGRSVRFNVVYGTDLFYARTAVDDILNFAQPLLADTGVLLLAHTPRIAELHSQLRNACKQRSLVIRYINAATFIERAEEVERAWTQVEVLIVASEKAMGAVTQSADWQWAEFEAEGRVERQQAEDEQSSADDSLAFSALDVADDL